MSKNTTAAAALQAKSSLSVLHRITFETSRLMDFFSEKELITQTGHQPDDWPLVIAKELIDNSLDACEDAGIAPHIMVKVDVGGITVADNGPGIPESTIAGTLDFSVKVSNREAYISPTRGAQGNALKTIVAMPFVLHGTQGRIVVEAHGVKHEIALTVDRIRQEPVVAHAKEPSDVRTGTRIHVRWPDSASSKLQNAKSRFLQIVGDYTILNPHVTLEIDWYGELTQVPATDPKWIRWQPSDPTSPHWYQPENLERLIAAYLAHDSANGRPSRTVREFISEFRGLSGSAKQKTVLAETGLSRASLADLVCNGAIDRSTIERLLAAMKAHSKLVKPAALGILGRDHLHQGLRGLGCAMETFEYRKAVGITEGRPWVIETAFAVLDGALDLDPDDEPRRLVTGVNFSPAIVNPFRELGHLGESLDSILANQRADAEEPVALVLHVTCPGVSFTDRGKSAVVIARNDGEEDAV